MRRALIATLSVVLVWLAMPVTPALAASDAKVVVIVGPVGSSTAHYKDDANDIVAEAKRYTLQRRQGLHPQRDVGRR